MPLTVVKCVISLGSNAPVIKDITNEVPVSYSKTGSIKFEYARNCKYFKNDQVNSYNILRLGTKSIMVFDGDYNCDKVLQIYASYFVDNCLLKIHSLNESIRYWSNFISPQNRPQTFPK